MSSLTLRSASELAAYVSANWQPAGCETKAGHRGLSLMAASLISEWKTLKRGRSGHRFEDRYDAHRRTKNRRTMLGRIARIGLAVVSIAVGILLMFIPGPAILFFLIAGGLLAAESREVARGLDWSEVRLRRISKWARTRWRKLSLVGKLIVGGLALAISAGGLFLGYRITFG